MKEKITDSVVYGNYEDKYHTKSRIGKILMDRFLEVFGKLLIATRINHPADICEVGCGEGELLKIIRKTYPSATIFACDLSQDQVELASQQKENEVVHFSVQNAESLTKYEDQSFDIVICAEVLEHLENPARGLEELVRISRKAILVSVPNEPIWRMLNLMRGKYWKEFGNTPGHLNHWSFFQFRAFLMHQNKFTITKTAYPLPWQMVLLEQVFDDNNLHHLSQ